MNAEQLEQQCRLENTFTDKNDMKKPFFTVEFTDEQVAQADRCEVWCSKFETGGTDFNLFRLMAGSRLIAEIRQDGY